MKDKPVILVVDDQPQNIELLEAQLVPQGYEIVKAANGEEALGKLSGNQIDLILLDVIMPGMDGFEVTRRVRLDDKIRQLPIILVTVLCETEDRVKGIEAGCDDFISKPVDKMELLARVRSLLKVKACNDLMGNYRKELESGITRRTDELKHALENLRQEITERKQAEKALRQSEEKFRGLFEGSRDALMTLEPPFWAFTSGNPAMVEMFRAKSEEEFISYTPVDLSPEQQPDGSASSEKAGQMIETAMRGGSHFFEWTHKRINGEEFPATVLLTRIEVAGKRFLQATVRDITERKRAEEKLRQSEEKFRRVIETALEGVWFLDSEFKTTDVNDAVVRILGYAREEFIGRPFIDFVFDEDRSMQAQEFQQRRRGISGQYERRVRCKNGSVKWLFFSAKAVMSAQGALVGTFAMITDITERKRMEAALKQASEDWQATFDAINDIVIMLNPGHEIMAINQTGLKAIGKTREEVIGQKCYRIVHGSEKPIKLCPCEKCLISSKIETSEYAQGGRTYELVACPIVDANNRIRAFTHIVKDITDRKRADEYVQNLAKFPSENPSPVMRMNRDGVILYANEASAPILSYWKCGPEMMVPESMKKILQEVFESRDKYTSEIQIDRKTYLFTMAPFPEDCYTNIYAVDITERKLAGEKLRESEEKYRNLVDGADEAILVVQDGMLKFINHKTAELSGYSGPDLMGKPFSEYIYPDDRTMVVDNYVKRMKGEPAPSRYEFRLLAVDGSAKWVEMNTVQIDWNSKPASLIFLTDISERKQHENEKEKLLAQLLQAQKMEAIGTLAGGVAHDFNNLLTAISGYTTMAMGKIDESDPVQRDLKQVSIAATKAAGVTRQLLLFSRKQHMEPVPMDPNATISHLLKMLDRLIGEDIVIETGLEKDVWSILGDEGNIEQVLMNLSVNARDAMPSGGKLFIKTENVILDQEYCRTCKTARPGRFVCVSVSDTGTGMDEMTQEHIFEPFFTTKEAGKGTGLGLSVVFGIVQQHKGWINIYSEFGHGTTIKVYFPASSARPEQKSKEEVPLASLQGKGERIMVVEDQAEVRELAVEILKTTGYSVFPVSSAKEAMEVFEKENGRFDLVFSDVVLTDMTGILLVENLLKRWKFGVIITSGYTDEKAHWDFIKENNYRFLHKPYTRHDLLHAVKDVLDEKKS